MRVAVPVPVRRVVPRIERMDPPAVPLVVVRVVHVAVPVGARFGLEAVLDLVHVPAQPLDHRLQHVVGQQPQPAVADLDRHVPVAHVVRDPREPARVVRVHLEQPLGCRLDRDHATVGKLQPVAVPQQRAARQVDADLLARHQGGAEPGALAQREVELDDLVDALVGTGQRGGHRDRHRVPAQNRK